uniref:Uncharacterized protein n=1 Tax=Tetranychus urticae TaxID=32264 RepID=T1JVP7_TETUR
MLKLYFLIPTVPILNHSHWFWSIRYNRFHDQLVWTCSSDSRVNLTRINSLASQPFGQLVDPDESEDELICSFEDYDGRLVINKVPKKEKFSLLF